MCSLKYSTSGIRRGSRISRLANGRKALDSCGILRYADPYGSMALQKCIRQARCQAARGLHRARELTDLEIWTETNYKVLSALAQEVKVEPEVISDLLYGMTVNKFNDLLSSVSKCDCTFHGCKVPMVMVQACEFYPAIFDKKRNLRSPMQPKAMSKLIKLLRQLSKQQPLDNGRDVLYGCTKSKVGKSFPWLQPGSLAYENGQRRRAMVDYNGRSVVDDLARDYLESDYLPYHQRRSRSTNDEARPSRSLYKKDLYKTPKEYAEAIKALQSIPMDMADRDGSESQASKHRHHHKLRRRSSTRHNRYYYGAQVPILAHEPFDARKPSTWIRRHPHPMRWANSDGTIVQDKPITRYKRASVLHQLDEARKRFSVRSEYNPSSNRNSVSSKMIPKVLRRTPSAISTTRYRRNR